MMILFLCVFANLLYHPCHFTKSQLKFLKLMAFFALFCLLSLCVILILGLPLDFYSLSRMLGCMLILSTFSIILKSSERVIWLGWGLLFGGGILILQIMFRWHRTVDITSMSHSYQIKNTLRFQTWNPNTPGNYAIMFAFILALISYEMSGIKKKIFWLTAGVFSLIPFFIFSRGAMAGIGVSWLVFILLARRNRPAKIVVVAMFIGVLIYLSIYERGLMHSAVRINFLTGQGLSGHDIMWRTALDLIAASPIVGYGFGQEVRLFSMRLTTGGMAHNAFLSVLVEVGLLGLLLFILPLGYLVYRFWRYTHGRFYDTRAVICFGFLLGILVLSLSYSALYWQKSQMIILSLMVVYLGKVEKFLFANRYDKNLIHSLNS